MLRPILDRVLIKRFPPPPEPPKDTVVIPQKYQQQACTGEVAALGQFVVMGGIKFPLTDFLQVGDVVRFSEYNFEEVPSDGVDYVLVRIQDIRGTLSSFESVPDATGDSTP